jgi:hypothetical protein
MTEQAQADGMVSVQTRRRRPYRIGLVVIAGAMWIVQSVLGGSQEILALCMASILVGAIAVWMCGIWSSIGMLLATLIAFFPVSALVMKSMMLEPIQDGLFRPETSFQIMCIGMVSASVAAILVNALGPGRGNNISVSGPLTQRSLRLLATLSTMLGLFGFVGHGLPGGWGRAASLLGNFLFLVPICMTQIVLDGTDGRRSMSFASAMSIVAVALISIGNNSKHGAIVPLLGYFLTCASYRSRLTKIQIVSAVVGAVFLLAVVAPAINIVRNLRDEVGFFTLLARTGDVTSSILSGNTEALDEQDPGDRVGYTNNYISSRSAGFDRLAFVSYIDAIIRFVGSYTVGYGPFIDEVWHDLIPNLSDPGRKEIGSNGDWVLRDFGVFPEDDSAQITLPLFGEGYVADGLVGVAVWSFSGFLIVSLELVFVFGGLRRNVLSLFLISMQGFLFASSGMSSLMFFVFRIAPLFVAVYVVCRVLGRGGTTGDRQYRFATDSV